MSTIRSSTCSASQVNVYLAGLRVLGDVVQGFLSNTIQRDLHVREKTALPWHVHLHWQASTSGQGGDQLLEQIAQWRLDQAGRVEFEQPHAHLGLGAVRQAVQFSEPATSFLWVVFPDLG